MSDIVSLLNLDMSDYTSYPVLHAQEYDNITRYIRIRLFENGEKYNLTNGVLVHIVGKQVASIDDSVPIPDDPDDPEMAGSMGICIKGIIIESAPAIIQFDLTQALLLAGIKKLKVIVTTYENNIILSRISSIPFYLTVEEECASEAKGYGSNDSIGSVYPFVEIDNTMNLKSLNTCEFGIESFVEYFDEENAKRSYVQAKPNVQFGFSFKNWIFDFTDKFEYVFRVYEVTANAVHYIFTNATNGTNTIAASPRISINIPYDTVFKVEFNINGTSVTYTGDASGFEYYYKIVYDSGMITLYRGSSLSSITEQVFSNQWEVSSVSNENTTPRVFYAGNGWNEVVSYTGRWYGTKVWKESILVHNYVPYTYGCLDEVENRLFQMDTPVTCVNNEVNGTIIAEVGG